MKNQLTSEVERRQAMKNATMKQTVGWALRHPIFAAKWILHLGVRRDA